ncbi:A disintegrin and metalloproteinase with thrombospondin motifs 9 isoform X2 [Paramormyrops kingsleyae]|uniref:A disintegrin and metalloproteinase with thrombospondin motifs 9 isoform X2 n=1 Tax=Paramormyrops kingsleyae TaxID=1676925 RepID=UPI003B972074
MHLLMWKLRLLALLPYVLNTVAITGRPQLTPRRAKSLEQLAAYEIVTPVRVNEAGDKLPPNVHYKRKKRSLDTAEGISSQWAPSVHYRLSAFGQDFHLNLTSDSTFIAPLYTVSIIGISTRNNLTDMPSDEEEDTDLQHCFYKGHVNAKEEHPAVISLCSGLLGTFMSPEGEYFVEPLHSYNGEHYEEEHNKPHLVYRKDALHAAWPRNVTECDTSGHKHRQRKHKRNQGKPFAGDMLAALDSLSESFSTDASSARENKQRANDSSASGPHRRSKRFLSYRHFVEVMLVADSKMLAHHGSNLQYYILTLMSIVASIYKDPSLGNLINIVIVKLVILSKESDNLKISFDAQDTLRNFCVWQQRENHPDDNHYSHHDTAILITRQDICRARDKCDTLGLAELGTVCDPYRSCSLSEDNGLSTAFTIAHELGHVFNMPHDDSNKCKEEHVKSQQHVMAPMLNYDTNHWTWSKCSRKYITDFLDTGYGECLLDEPISRPYVLPQQLAGQTYSVNKQCELIFGPGMQVCPYMMQCRRLWCTRPEEAQRGCRTQHMPWADGTECASGKHCRHGACVPREQETPPVDGAWGVWSPFGTCSRTCGGGIKIGVRECNRPIPRNGGDYCVGRRMKFRSCNSEPCFKQRKDFREEQCSAFDGRHFNINGLPTNVRWVPKYKGIVMKDRCKLFCRVAGSTAYYQLRDRVIDGTPCSPDTNDICVQGLCRQAGCDHILNSKAREDMCGVCGGDNSSCKAVTGTFNTIQYGYNVVVHIPSGATNIDIWQHSYFERPEDDNYLAISNSRGEFLLNGDFVVSMFKREIKVGGAVLEYSGSDHVVERINCTDKTEEEIVVQVLSVGKLHNPDIRYSYNVPVEDRFSWDAYGPWLECSQLCQGNRQRRIVCNRESDRMEVSDQRCYGSPLPTTITEPCNTECELRWHVARKGECSAQCGPGFRILEIYCTKHSDGETKKVEERYCSNQHKPGNKEHCMGDCTPVAWEYSPWTECSKTCGGGTRRRVAVCGKSTGVLQDESKCSQQDKLTVEPCNEFLCPQWKTGEWSECLVTCGKGSKHRQTWCQFGEEHLDDQFCDDSKPESVQACQQQECASWQIGPWGQCSTTCGPGYQQRVVKCVVGSYGSVMDDIDCNAATRPTGTQDCELQQCPEKPPTFQEPKLPPQPIHTTQWRFGSWTQCSATCGKGSRMRYVSCRDNQGGVAEESACSHLPKPPAQEVCSVVACGQWKVLEWTLCSVTCGQGKATRQVACVNFSDQAMHTSECDPDDRPVTEQECSMPHCPTRPDPLPKNRSLPPSDRSQWRTGPWGACSSTCAGGFQRRVVVCQDENGSPAGGCEEQTRPEELRSCQSGPCPQWVYGSWGECTKPCGNGMKTRQVVCQSLTGRRFHDLSCDILDKPPDREQCNTEPCPSNPHWNAGPWSSCSAACGKGYRYRKVTCVSRSGRPVPEESCQKLPPPNRQRRCRGGRCPKWKTGSWGECSSSCGRGVQTREVVCDIAEEGSAEHSECPLSARPPSSQTCQVAECPETYRWTEGDWTECSQSCGSGHRLREPLCLNRNGEQVHDALCAELTRPADTESCNLQPCDFLWITGEWSECSVTCGQGYRRRLVSCSEVHSGKDHYEYGYQSSFSCPGTPPESVLVCSLPPCPHPQAWRAGIWGPCSVTCGEGVSERTVQCVTSDGEDSEGCPPQDKPEGRRRCSSPPCHLAASCSEVQRLTGLLHDGEQLLRIEGRALTIYCADMHSGSPKEYITLRAGSTENFSEVFGFRLSNPMECPYNGTRREDCNCRKDYIAAGLSAFSKVRLDLGKMQIITTDWQFSLTQEGHQVPFATAGDCYSAAQCPQDGSKVTGMCGGYCGKCTLFNGSGLHVKVK